MMTEESTIAAAVRNWLRPGKPAMDAIIAGPISADPIHAPALETQPSEPLTGREMIGQALIGLRSCDRLSDEFGPRSVDDLVGKIPARSVGDLVGKIPARSVDDLVEGLRARTGVVHKREFAQRLERQIIKLGLNKTAIHKASGIPKNTLTRYFSGDSLPKAEHLFPLADALRIDARWLLTGVDQPKPSTTPNSR